MHINAHTPIQRKDVDALSEYEQVIASEIILPSDIRVKFSGM